MKVVFKNFPISSHKYAPSAAMAALAAGQQGKFWEYHDELFKNYNHLNDEKIQEIAKLLSLDEARFNQDREDRSLINRIHQDIKEGNSMGVRGTPAIFINGKQFRKKRSMKNMEAIINEELKARKAKKE